MEPNERIERSLARYKLAVLAVILIRLKLIPLQTEILVIVVGRVCLDCRNPGCETNRPARGPHTEQSRCRDKETHTKNGGPDLPDLRLKISSNRIRFHKAFCQPLRGVVGVTVTRPKTCEHEAEQNELLRARHIVVHHSRVEHGHLKNWSRSRDSNPDNFLTKEVGYLYITTAQNYFLKYIH